MKQRIQEVIVVEGRNDTLRLQRLFDCDTIETHGTCLSEFTIHLIQKAESVRGVIIFTDPDAPGNQIRSILNQKIPGCRNAFVDKEDARTEKKVGVEHAADEALIRALEHLVTIRKDPAETITAQDFYELGLMGQKDSAERRDRIGKKLHLGSGNAKTLRQRMNCLCITKEELAEAMHE